MEVVVNFAIKQNLTPSVLQSLLNRTVCKMRQCFVSQHYSVGLNIAHFTKLSSAIFVVKLYTVMGAYAGVIGPLVNR